MYCCCCSSIQLRVCWCNVLQPVLKELIHPSLSLNHSNTGIQSAKINKSSTLLFLCHVRSSRSSWATEGIREDSWRGGAHPDELGECVHGNQERTEREREKKRKGHDPPSLYPVNQSHRVPSACASAFIWIYLSSFASSSSQFPCLEAYVTYCCNQVGAKALLDQKKQEKRVEHFLRLCQESSFSRKLDLWNFLDLPRSRLVKYPLLLKEIQKCTPSDHPDEETLPDAVSWCPAYIRPLWTSVWIHLHSLIYCKCWHSEIVDFDPVMCRQ